jgi:hypothetical protein
MKSVLVAMAMVFGLGLTSQAKADIPAWACNMTFKGEAKGVKLIIGKYNLDAKGSLRCVSASGVTESYPITLKAKSRFIGPQVALGKLQFVGAAANIALFTNNPQDLLGNYLLVHGQASVIRGAGVLAAAHTDIPALTVNLSLQFTKGFGVNLGLEKLAIELDHDRM